MAVIENTAQGDQGDKVSAEEPVAADRKADVGQNTGTASSDVAESNASKERQRRATAKQKGKFKPSEEISEDYSVSFPVDI